MSKRSLPSRIIKVASHRSSRNVGGGGTVVLAAGKYREIGFAIHETMRRRMTGQKNFRVFASYAGAIIGNSRPSL